MISILKVFLMGFVIDLAYVLWMRMVTQGYKWKAGAASVMVAAPALFGYVAVFEDRYLAIPYLLGLFWGTVLTLWAGERYATKDERPTGR